MNSVINKATVLVLNRNWQAINIRTPAEAFCQMAAGVATALEIFSEEHIRPVIWEEWIQLPIREQHQAVHTFRRHIHMATVIVLASFARVANKRRTLCANTVHAGDGHQNQSKYIGVQPEEGSIV